jgi:hypothetical protein
LERAEFLALAELGRLPQGNRRRVARREALAKAREAKSAWLARNPSILRKISTAGLSVSLPVPADAIAKAIRETSDRIAEEKRLAKRKRRYQAPPAFYGQDVRLVDGRTLRVPADGMCELELADDHPAGNAGTSVHHQLTSLHVQTNDHEDPIDSIGKALRSPIVGDRALLAFLSRNAGAAAGSP